MLKSVEVYVEKSADRCLSENIQKVYKTIGNMARLYVILFIKRRIFIRVKKLSVFNLPFIFSDYHKDTKKENLNIKIKKGQTETIERRDIMKKKLLVCVIAMMTMAMAVGCGTNTSNQQTQTTPETQTTETTQQTNEARTTDPTAVDVDVIGEDKAKEIALAEVSGATVDDIWSFDLDYDDGRWVYEGEIHKGDWEYEFDIDAKTGDIVSWDKEHIYD